LYNLGFVKRGCKIALAGPFVVYGWGLKETPNSSDQKRFL